VTIPARSFAAQDTSGVLSPFNLTRRDPQSDDVVIDILYCGVCHSDLHAVRSDWIQGQYPMVPGHEIVGRVRSVGPEVRGLAPGDPVGVGCMVNACRQCGNCGRGWEQYCESGTSYTYGSVDRVDGSITQGGYSDLIVVPDYFALRLPRNLDLSRVAPLLCAGITNWTPLEHWNVGPGSRVAIVGLGGLGHMGVKLAKGLGAHVTLFTRSPNKQADARRLGADAIVLSTDAAQMAGVAGTFDLIIDTVPVDHDVNPYVPTLRTGGTMVMVGYLGPLSCHVDMGAVIFGHKALAGTLIGGIRQTQAMLDFCGEKGIDADVEIIRMQDIQTAFERLERADVRYRFVIDMATL
jgi:alcohol dehydrogenase (NADP+)